MLAALQGREPLARYDGYGACPFTTARGRMLLAELDYSLTPHPMLAFIDTQRDATTGAPQAPRASRLLLACHGPRSRLSALLLSPACSSSAPARRRRKARCVARPRSSSTETADGTATPWKPKVPVYVQLGQFRVDGLG